MKAAKLPSCVLHTGRVGTWRQTKGPNLNCFIYARSATVWADSAIQLNHQVTACEALIDRMAADGWVHRRTVTEHGISGNVLCRPGLLEALAAIKSGRADVLVIDDSARLSRSKTYLEQIRAYVASLDGRIVSPFPMNWATAGARLSQRPPQLIDHCKGVQDYRHVSCDRLSRLVNEWVTLTKRLGVTPTQKGGPRHE